MKHEGHRRWSSPHGPIHPLDKLARRRHDPRPIQSSRVLLADDDDDMRTLLATLLRRVGFQVAEASDGDELLSLFGRVWENGASQSLLIVSDIGMPHRDGIEVTRQLRAAAPTVPVILVTAFADLTTLRAARTAGATTVILKPIDRRAFVETVLALLAPEPAPK